MIWKELVAGVAEIFKAGDPLIEGVLAVSGQVGDHFDRLLWELDNRIASSVEMRGLAAKQRDEVWKAVWAGVKESNLSWTSDEPDWPLRCHTQSGDSHEFYSAIAFQSWLKSLAEVRNGFGELVARYPPDDMTYDELAKLIGLAVARGANVESVVSAIEKANAAPDLAQQVLDTVYAARLNTARKPGGIVTPYKPITTNEQGIVLHAPEVDWARGVMSPWFATLFATPYPVLDVLGAPSWTFAVVVGLYVLLWMLGAGERWGDDDG